jgi:hypothetical protein
MGADGLADADVGRADDILKKLPSVSIDGSGNLESTFPKLYSLGPLSAILWDIPLLPDYPEAISLGLIWRCKTLRLFSAMRSLFS